MSKTFHDRVGIHCKKTNFYLVYYEIGYLRIIWHLSEIDIVSRIRRNCCKLDKEVEIDHFHFYVVKPNKHKIKSLNTYSGVCP